MPSPPSSTSTWSPHGVSLPKTQVNGRRLCLHHKHVTTSRLHPHPHGSLLLPSLRLIFHVLCPRINANPLRWFHARTDLRTHGRPQNIRTYPTYRIHSIREPLLPSKQFALLLLVFLVTILIVSLAA